MRAYYALVDDILPWDEFEEEVCSLNLNPDDEESENRAAAEVVLKYGRLHPKISQLSPKPTLNSFFCRVIEKGPVTEFTRSDNTPGLVTRILAGDDTGEAVLVFWDEKVPGTEEINKGDVLEVAGRFKSLSNIVVVDLRRADCCSISLREDGIKTLEPSSLRVFVIETGGIAEFIKKDGSSGRKSVLFVCDEKESARITVWNPEILEGISEGMSVNISGALPKPSLFKEYSLGDNSTIEVLSEPVNPVFTKLAEAEADEFCNITGFAESVCPICGYPRDTGDILWLKKGIIRDDTKSMPFVLWGRHAKNAIFEGDRLTFYNCRVKYPCFEKTVSVLKEPEIHAGYNTCLISDPVVDGIYAAIKGVVEDFIEGPCLANEKGRYFLRGEILKESACGCEAYVSGVMHGHIIDIKSADPVSYDHSSLTVRLNVLKQKFSD
ncbi:MAG: hypothetical protein PHV39_03590 [Methanomicrobium sp.]|nr:hypothetical protein [Methanomicrobium sp.]